MLLSDAYIFIQHLVTNLIMRLIFLKWTINENAPKWILMEWKSTKITESYLIVIDLITLKMIQLHVESILGHALSFIAASTVKHTCHWDITRVSTLNWLELKGEIAETILSSNLSFFAFLTDILQNYFTLVFLANKRNYIALKAMKSWNCVWTVSSFNRFPEFLSGNLIVENNKGIFAHNDYIKWFHRIFPKRKGKNCNRQFIIAIILY